MIEETARHLGHLDVLRELTTDGTTGEWTALPRTPHHDPGRGATMGG